MKYLKYFEHKDIDPFDEEDWDEGDTQFFYDEETHLELEYKKTMKYFNGWNIKNFPNDKIYEYVEKKYKFKRNDKPSVDFILGYVVRDKIEEYKKQLK